MKWLVWATTILLMAAGVPNLAAAAASATISGPAVVKDGDSIFLGPIEVRLEGIDAFELGQWCKDQSGRDYACGARAAAALRGYVKGNPVRCEIVGRDRHRRPLGRCFVGSGESAINLNAKMAMEGWAIAYRRFSKQYLPEERTARKSKLGAWRGTFIAPWSWRRGSRKVYAPK